MAGDNTGKEGRKEVKLSLDADAAALLLQLAGSQRKQGEYVSNLIRAVAKQAGLSDLEEIQGADVATLRQVVQRLRRDLIARVVTLEQEVADLKAKTHQEE